MAKIVPIRGVRYSTGKAGSMEELITPPYDVIDTIQQQGYYSKNPYNIIRLEYGETRVRDDDNDNRYTRARGFFKHWLQQEVLIHEERPSLYLYEQEFIADERKLVRSGFMAGVGLEEYASGIILPHEETLSKAKADRYELLRHCEANFSPIFGLYDDPTLAVETIAARYKQNDADIDFTDENGEKHRLWVVSDPDDLAAIQAFFTKQKIYIADGHHRYETALKFHKEKIACGEKRFGFCLMTLVNLHDPGLVIFPTHRLLRNISGFDRTAFLEKLAEKFTVSSVELSEDKHAAVLSNQFGKLNDLMNDYNAYLLYLGDGRLYCIKKPRNESSKILVNRYGSYSPEWRSLDVAVLQGLILEEILGIDSEARARGLNLRYTREEENAMKQVDTGEYQAVFYLNPTQVREVTEVAAAGDKMPQKSTYFYPKLVTGLVINDFSQ